MNNNFIEFGKFRDQIKTKEQLSNGNESFLAEVTYNWNNRTELEVLEATLFILGYESGTISLQEGEILNSTVVHMDFKPNYQDYKFNSVTKSIEIRDSSNKLGDYFVEIREV